MKDIVREYQEQFRRHRMQLRRYTALLLALAMVTTLFVNWQLHSDGIAKTADYQCGLEEHTHTADCYPKVLVCGYEEGEPEDWTVSQPDADTITDDSFGADPEPEVALQSAEPEYIWVPHEHTADCYQEVTTEVPVLTCFEEEHVHTDDCFDPEDGSLICDQFEHTHDDSCYTIEYETEEQLVCGLEEGELVEELNPDYNPVAMFEAPAAAAKPVVVAPVAEGPVHHHTDACYAPDYTADPICGLKEHHHTVNCLSDPLDGLEDESDWLDKTGTALTGMWNEDLLTVAQGQLGYEQSEKNFKLDTDDGETLRYYTRYGAWYGNPYGEWDVMFLSYCLNYANIPQSTIPQRASTLALRSELRSTGYLLDPDSDIAAYEMDADMSVTGLQPGDIVFYNATTTETIAVADEPQIEDLSPDADTKLLQALSAPAAAEPQTEERTVSCETVGIVSAVDEASGTLTVISGNVDGKVSEVSLALSQLTGMIPVASVQAAESADAAVQSGDITSYVYSFAIRKKDGKSWIPATDFTTSDSVQAEFEFKGIPVTALEEGEDGSYFAYIPLPEGIDCSMLEGGDIKDSDYQDGGGVSGKYSFIQEGDHWVIVLNYDEAYVEQHETAHTTIKGDVSFEFQWDESSVTEEGQKKSITIGNHTIEVTIKNDEKPQPVEKKFSLNKKAGKLTYDEETKTAYIDYTVTLDVKQDMSGPLTMEDVLTSNGFDYVDSSLKINSSDVKISWANSTSGNGKTLTIGKDGETIPAGIYTITYRVQKTNFGVNADEFDSVENKISMRKDDESHSSDEKTSTSTKLIEKSGKASTDKKTGDTIITWTVKLNSGDAKRYLQKATFTDTIEAGQEYVLNSFTVKENGSPIKDATPTINGTTLSYALKDGYNSYTITYKTKVTEHIPLEGLKVSNTGNIDGDNDLHGNDTGSVDLKDEVLKKEADGDPTVAGNKATLNWKSTINVDNLNGYVYYDYSDTFYLDSQHVNLQSIDLNDIQVLDKDQVDVTNQVTISTYSEITSGAECGLFKIDFGSADIHGPVTIKYKTTVDASRLGEYANITNKCYIVKDGHRQDASASQHIHNVEDLWKTLIKYGADWNMTGKDNITIGVGDEIPWTVELNCEKVITGSEGQWIVDDTLPAGMLLDRASISLDFNGRHPNPVEGTDYTISVFKNTEGRTVLRIVFEETAYQNDDGKAAKIKLTYKTTLDPESEFCKGDQATKDFVNDVSFTHDGKKQDTNFTQTVTRNVVGKHGQFDSSTNLLSYTIEVNPDGSKLSQNGSDLELYDKLKIPEGLKKGHVSLEDITVFEAERQDDGSLVATNPIGDGLQRVDNQNEIDTSHYYTKPNSDVSQIEFWTKVPDSKPLVLVVTYLVRDNLNGVKPGGTFTFTNEVTLGSKWKTEDKGSSASFSSGSSSGLDYNADRLTVMKYSGNQSNPLAGASFTLKKFDSANSAWTDVKSFDTDSTGSYTLGNLARNTLYELTETAAPAGYLLPEPNKPYYFYITTDLNKNPIPAAADVKDATVYTVEDGVYRNFTFYRNNARNPDYVKKGDLLVKKAWKNHDGSELTDESKMQDVLVTLTKHVAKPGHRILLQLDDGSGTKVFAENINNGGNVYISGWNHWLSKDIVKQLPDGVTIEDTHETAEDNTPIYKISNISSDITIKSQNLYYNCGICYRKDGGTPITGTTDTEVGKVTLNSKNGWSARFENLEIGDGITYTIKEMFVDGYTASYTLNNEALDADAPFELGQKSGSGDTIVITNTAEKSDEYELPSTGGAGTTPYTAVGGAIALAALVCGLCKKRRRERRAPN